MLTIPEVNTYFARLMDKYLSSILEADTSSLKKYRIEAAANFNNIGLPPYSNEMWRNFAWEKITQNTYAIQQHADAYRPVETFFNCAIRDIDSYMFTFLNGWYVHNDAPLTIFPNGVIIGSLRAAKERSLSFIQPYIQDMNKGVHSGLYHINSALWQDGFFIYIPDNIHFDKPVQIANIVETHQDLLINTRNLVIVGKNASLKLIHCDDTLKNKNTLINSVTEIIVAQDSRFDYFKMENEDNNSVLLNNVLIYQYERSTVNTHTNTFNGGLVHNTIYCSLLESHASVYFNGLYMADKNQNITNCLQVNHYSSHCTSQQSYNGIVDDAASARFVGHVFVAPNAQKTEAYQLNRNILLANDSFVETKPFLEIYADDVKCSHGATIGQLDDDAIFYLRSRGICEKNARILLMHAFAKEILDKISIASLADYTEELVRKRLKGETISCTQCALRCDNRTIDFEVNPLDV
ncbi:MAG: Fe-S cluster assembly protein SufD [Bacteroidales bacterium]|jgi:Fe-S cluster assembly protein SufD|nr:Fe-S cluster assembly protein SufD [Bacteroidales bacterium]